MDKILPMILVDILLLVVFGFIVYKAIQKATQNKVLFLEKEANDLVEKAKREELENLIAEMAMVVYA